MSMSEYNEKRTAQVAAKELNYSEEAQEIIRKSKDIKEIRRTMATERERMLG